MALHRIEGPVGVDLTATSTGAADFALGTKAVFRDTTNDSIRIFRYARTDGLRDQKAWYTLDQNYDVGAAMTSTTLNTAQPCGVCTPHYGYPLPAPTATYAYGWVQTGGYFPGVSALSACAASAEIYSSATAGAVDDAFSAHRLIAGLRMSWSM
jgi:hypothetical protein